MRVQTPPNIEANDSGIRSLEGLTLMSWAMPMTMGMKMATTAVWLTNADRTPTVSINTMSASQKLRLADPGNGPANEVDGAGLEQPGAQHEQGGDGNSRTVAETGESFARRDDAAQQEDCHDEYRHQVDRQLLRHEQQDRDRYEGQHGNGHDTHKVPR